MLIRIADVVREVGSLLLEWRTQGITGGHWDGAQYKAKADSMAHNELVARLRSINGKAPVISEEDVGSLAIGRPDNYWLIDPIDGTASFAHNYPGFVTQVALVKDNQPVLAAVYAPALDLLYLAEKGSGSSLNGNRLKISQVSQLDSLIDNYPEPRGIAGAAFRQFGFKRYIECGSISLKICKVADGTADLFLKDVAIRDWDIAAPHLIIEEAGGYLTDIGGNNFRYLGSFENKGLIAAPAKEVCNRVASWHQQLTRGVD